MRISPLTLSLLLVACTTTFTRTKNPVFAIPIDSLQARLDAQVMPQHVNIDGRETTTNGKSGTELEIDIVNGQHIPGDDTAMKALAHSVAVEVKHALKDKNAYERYTVLFVTEVSSGSETRRSWISQTFKNEEL